MPLSADFDQAFQDLLVAYNRHEDNRRREASIAQLSRSAQELHRARMHAHRALKTRPRR